jgi:hypothetical protein
LGFLTTPGRLLFPDNLYLSGNYGFNCLPGKELGNFLPFKLKLAVFLQRGWLFFFAVLLPGRVPGAAGVYPPERDAHFLLCSCAMMLYSIGGRM